MSSRKRCIPAMAAVFLSAAVLGLFCLISGIKARQPEADASRAASFLTGNFAGGVIRSDKEALEAVYHVIDEIGGNSETILKPYVITPTQNGVTYYSFRQVENGLPVSGAAVKLITDPSGKAMGLVSSIGSAKEGGQGRLQLPYAAALKTPVSLDRCTADVWNSEIRLADGNSRQLAIPVLSDPVQDRTYLCDRDRGILCADYRAFTEEHRIEPYDFSKEENAADTLLIYDNFIRIYDFFRRMGWQGPDGQNTPILLLMNLSDENGKPVNNAFYQGKTGGYQIFSFGKGLGSCTDVIGHEFMHCVTETAMAGSLYCNEYGAINEGLSDIMGNLVEILLEGDSSGSWVIGENTGQAVRSLKEPNLYGQPAALKDLYYISASNCPEEGNDNGGVHTNSSILGTLSYQLHQAGMSEWEQCYFWMNAVLAMTPYTDFEQLEMLLPWCMNLSGFPEYADDLVRAMREAGFGDIRKVSYGS